MSEYIETPITVAVHLKAHKPIYGEQVTTVTVDDESGGPFILIKQNTNEGLPDIRLNMDELEAVVIAARKLIDAHEALQVAE